MVTVETALSPEIWFLLTSLKNWGHQRSLPVLEVICYLEIDLHDRFDICTIVAPYEDRFDAKGHLHPPLPVWRSSEVIGQMTLTLYLGNGSKQHIQIKSDG